MFFLFKGEISLIPATLDYETVSRYHLDITLSDPAGLTAAKVVTINVIDENEAPVIQNLPNKFTIVENKQGDIDILTVSTVDEDGDVVLYSLTTNPFSTYFQINSAGNVTSKYI